AALGEALEVLMEAVVLWLAAELVGGDGVVARAERALRALCVTVFASTVTVAGVGLLAAARVIDLPGAYAGGRLLSTLQYGNSLGAFLLMGCLVGLGLWTRQRGLLAAATCGLGVLLNFLAILGSQSRGTWMVYPLAILLFLAGLRGPALARALYAQALVLVAGSLLSRPFYGAVLAGDVAAAGRDLGLAAAGFLAGEVLFWRGRRFLAEQPISRPTRQALQVLAGLYAVTVVVVYFVYTASVLPAFYDRLAPAAVIERAESIGLGDASVQTRLAASGDALRIALDHPWLGTGGGGWNALYHLYQDRLYWTTEVHNHFFQVWVEAGTPGLILLVALWALFVAHGVALHRTLRQEAGADWGQPGDRATGSWLIHAGLLSGTLALGVHSAFDFDLSLPALALLVWAAFGAVEASRRVRAGMEG
ncbi:MAG: O-antigen ligase family protein, partial [Clostridia bacterium]|nr:O-antigen ligase family protein [Clostridia bacterium]